MANIDIINRVYQKLDQLKNGEITYTSLADFLNFSVSALEAVPHKIQEESYDFEYEFNEIQYANDEGFLYPGIEDIIKNFENWLDTLKKNHC